MRMILAVLGTALAASLAATPAVSAQESATTQTAPMAGHLIGRADADMRLAEYVSYTCPHCAHFEQEAGDMLKLAYARPGHVGVEIRHLVRDPLDLTVALIANCGKPVNFAANHAVLMKAQPQWLDRIRATTPAQRARYETGTNAARRQALARDAGLYDLMKGRGYTPAALDRCIADDTMAQTLATRTRQYAEAGVTGTPSFAIDGTLLPGVHDWAALKPVLDARILS
ncbi:thioredoxin domain-containing protein [uncultured Croceicoccus sp.]|uniref:DsbA family protein n=1 Tax=uncultured Croceicoccus sp. TaxID=1295329 RepID=UPI002628AF77|nr:thioredoxin domain-containing protein [uncultured Croceicoccus sp.]